LFEGARFSRAPDAGPDPAATIDGWVSAFEARRRAIVDRAPCPASGQQEGGVAG
jgi:hypothetical protein